MSSVAGVLFNIDFLHEQLGSTQFCGRVYVPLAFSCHLFVFVFVLCIVSFGEVYLIQHHVIKFVSDLRKFGSLSGYSTFIHQ